MLCDISILSNDWVKLFQSANNYDNNYVVSQNKTQEYSSVFLRPPSVSPIVINNYQSLENPHNGFYV
jgi:hypothetical protein